MTLDQIEQKALSCQNCTLAKNRNRVVFGQGSPRSKILFIGEAPGKNEDEQGQPFVGAAGKFLNEMLEIIGLKRETVYIANVVKCRPPNNRDPLPEEVAACWPYLLEQIKTIQPLLIVTLGRHSLNRFLPEYKISQAHGRALRKELPGLGRQVFLALYHPAAALYNGSMREILIKDFKKIPKILKLLEK